MKTQITFQYFPEIFLGLENVIPTENVFQYFETHPPIAVCRFQMFTSVTPCVEPLEMPDNN